MMPDEGERIASLALGWVGTPFDWQSRVKGVGCDCKGLVAGVAAEAGRPEAHSIEALAADYGVRVDVRRLQAGLAALFDRVSGPVVAGDVLLIRLAGRAQHLALVVEAVDGRARRIVHTHPGIGKVIAVPVGTMMQESIASVWRWKVLGN